MSPPDKNPSGLGVFEFPLRHPGQYDDPETGLFYNYFRDCYDPVLGRYCQSDPIGLRGGINRYVYANSRPLQFTDAMGLAPWAGFNWCGPGDNGLPPVNCIDQACMDHDKCYDRCGATASTRWLPLNLFSGCTGKCDYQFSMQHKKCKDDEFCRIPREPFPPLPTGA